ncbi:hypothetical protein [Amycolatopsis nalaikhensis]|uniref:Uncharacterized protein n=1 Tax=Amycolatopsis nalaikhensis TaxID=715472 RepID=A0ABY8XIJ1_9PSEU|nr:hypothetical protein [Amycolatopsis sp. 2-2]WIV55418.1 hypothetical protein QP939_42470 [Amycolatopsis sp. 2-2]
MKEGKQGPRPNKKTDGKPTKKRSIIKIHPHKKPNGHKSSNKQQREHNNRHGESFARDRGPTRQREATPVGKRVSKQRKEDHEKNVKKAKQERQQHPKQREGRRTKRQKGAPAAKEQQPRAVEERRAAQ